MKSLEITTKIGCAVSCDYCPQDVLLDAYKGRKTLALGTLKTVLGKLPEGVSINFCGFSEPFGNPKCAQMIVMAHEYGFPVYVYTTTVGMSRDDFEMIKDVPFRHFVIHKVPQANPDIVERCRSVLDNCLTETRTNKNVNSRAGNLEGPMFLDVGEREGRFKCSVSKFDNNVLLPNGDVILCCMDYGLTHVLGNLSKKKKVVVRAKSYELCSRCHLGIPCAECNKAVA